MVDRFHQRGGIGGSYHQLVVGSISVVAVVEKTTISIEIQSVVLKLHIFLQSINAILNVLKYNGKFGLTAN